MREETRKALSEHFVTGWAVGGEPFPIYFANQKHAENSATWGRLSFVYGVNEPSAVGTAFFRCLGMLWLQVFIPPDGGSAPANIAADKLEAMFIDQAFQITSGGQALTIQIETGVDGPRQVPTQEGWSQFNLSLDFRVETAR